MVTRGAPAERRLSAPGVIIRASCSKRVRRFGYVPDRALRGTEKGNFRFPLRAFSPRVGEGRLLSGFALSFFAEGKRKKERRHGGKRVQMFSLIPKRACSGFLRRPIRERRSGNPTGEAIIRGPEGRGGNGRRRWQELRRAPWFPGRASLGSRCRSQSVLDRCLLRHREASRLPQEFSQCHARTHTQDRRPKRGRLRAAPVLSRDLPRSDRVTAGARRRIWPRQAPAALKSRRPLA